MKMNMKKTALLILCGVLSATMCACSNGETLKNNTIESNSEKTTDYTDRSPELKKSYVMQPDYLALLSSESFEAEEKRDVINVNNKTFIKENASTHLILNCMEKNIQLSYIKTEATDISVTDIYKSADNLYECHYIDQKPIFLRINDPELIPERNKTEAEYINWLNNLMKQYGINDLSAYRYTCKTVTETVSDNDSFVNSYDYFYELTDENNDHGRVSLYNYRFTFTKYIGDQKTSDRVEFYLFSDAMMLKISRNQFEGIEEIHFDENETYSAVSSFLITPQTPSNRVLNVHDKYLTFINGRLCCVYTVGLDIVSEDGVAHDDLFDVVVFLKDADTIERQ